MHFSNLILASAMTLAPAVYGYGVATVEIAYHEACANNDKPTNNVDTPESTVVTKGTCTQLPAKHSFGIDAYSFDVTPITKDTTYTCHGVAVYTNDECVGIPLTVIPFWPGQEDAKSGCVQEEYFEKSVSVRLICDDEHHDNDHHHDDHDNDNDDHDEHSEHDDDHDDHDDHDENGEHDDDHEDHAEHDEYDEGEEEGEEDRQPQAPQPKGKNSFLSGLGL